MKRVVIVLLSVLVLVCLCSCYSLLEQITCSHLYIKQSSSKEPTCTEDGYWNYKCSECGHFKKEIKEKLGHNFVETENVKPTCISDGHIEYVCTRCGEKNTEIIVNDNKTEHIFVLDTERTVVNDCYEHIVYVCSNCGVEDIQNTIHQPHSYVEDVERSYPPTCTKEGLKVFVCERCGDQYEEKISTIPHSYVEDVEKSYPPTCTENGLKVYVCETCGKSKSEVVQSLGGHIQDEKSYNYCSRCKSPISMWNGPSIVIEDNFPIVLKYSDVFSGEKTLTIESFSVLFNVQYGFPMLKYSIQGQTDYTLFPIKILLLDEEGYTVKDYSIYPSYEKFKKTDTLYLPDNFQVLKETESTITSKVYYLKFQVGQY